MIVWMPWCSSNYEKYNNTWWHTTFGLIVNIEYGRTLLILQEGIEKLKASHKQIEAEKKKVESALVKERKAHGDKTLPTVLTAKHHLALSATLSGKSI